MRSEHDRQRDVMKFIFTDRPIVRSEDRGDGEFRSPIHFDADGNLVCHELHNYSKQEERWTPTGRQEFRPDAEATEEIGSLDWTVCDGKTAEVLDQGHTTVRLCDVMIEVIESKEDRQASKLVRLTKDFYFGVVTSLSATPEIVGFAIQAGRNETDTFCWEWFNLTDSAHATKLQEEGELGIEIRNPGEDWQVVRTDFLTDVSLRVKIFGEPVGSPPAWRVLVRKGASIRWPSVVQGQVRLF